MMTMREVSRYFDRVQASNPITGAPLFLCQFANYDGSKRDAFAAYRRVMSTDPDTAVQPGHVVSALAVLVVGNFPVWTPRFALDQDIYHPRRPRFWP